MSTTSASAVLRDAAELYEPVAEEKGVALRLHLGPSRPVEGDHDLLLEAVGNLVDNAVKFAPAGTEVLLAACCTEVACGATGWADVRSFPLPCPWKPALPFKLNHDRRHHIPRQKHRVTNSAAYDAALRQRGSLTVWFTDEAIVGWQAALRTTPGGQPWYSPLAILTGVRP
jgi:signal transduction histidine kinase